MNKTELIAAVAKETEVSKKAAAAVIDATIANVTKALKKGEKVQLIGFGTFEVRKRTARTGKNPRTGAPVKIPATKAPAFKAGAALKKAVNTKGGKKK